MTDRRRGKVLERLIRLSNHIKTLEGLSPNQHGFRRGRSILEASSQLSIIIERVKLAVIGAVRNSYSGCQERF